MSSRIIVRAYNNLYKFICGDHPQLLPWHFQWLTSYYLRRCFRRLLPGFRGLVLDVGCGSKPYQKLFESCQQYIGLDVVERPSVDVVVLPNDFWPWPNGYFDVLFSSQVLDDVKNLDFTLSEMCRVLKEGGHIILTVPFIYNEHSAPSDFWRFTVYGTQQLFPDFEIVCVEKLGGIGSTLALLLLNWLSNHTIVKAMLPIWIPFSFVVNVIGYVLDCIDKTGFYYNNVLLVAKKKSVV